MASKTALIVIDPYNDLLHPKGKVTAMVAESLKEANSIANIKKAIEAARTAGLTIIYGLHQQYKTGKFEGWNYLAGIHQNMEDGHVFEEGQFGSEIYEGLEPQPSDIMATRHWSHNSFINTDLDFLLHKHDITTVAVVGLEANTCFEATSRGAYEQGYKVIMLADATAAFTPASLKDSAERVWPLFAYQVKTVAEWISTL